jgi:UDPglucose--hexose-1-phosphate uridylyltransferase
MAQGEIRQNKATKEWVIYSPDRGARPYDFKEPRTDTKPLQGLDRDCPFCVGNEHMLPPTIMEVGHREGEKWQVKVVPNKFPALTPERDTARFQQGIYVTMYGYGQHEVVIESPFHNQDVSTMSAEEAAVIIDTYHKRYLHLMESPENVLTIIFRNHGRRAGTSLVHPHSQIVATGVVPNYIRYREEECQRYYDEWGRCVYCDILEYELHERRRVIYENQGFLGFVPFAAEVPFQIRIIPKRHEADFGDITAEEKAGLTDALRECLYKLHDKLDDPAYNYVIHSCARYKASEPHLHWNLEIRPRLTMIAGFEIGSGMVINPSLPERDADYLNGVETS